MSTTAATADTDSAPVPPTWLARHVAFMEHVAEVCSSPGGRSDLRTGQTRRGLAEPWLMLPHLQSRLPRGLPERKTAYLAAAAMFAAHAPSPASTTAQAASVYDARRGNLGWSLARAVRSGLLSQDTATELLQLMARQRRLTGLLHHLQPLVDRLAAEQVPLSWPHLLRDLTRWTRYRTEVADQWMSSHYDPADTTEDTAEEHTA
ncbi:hypothetical protein A6A06_01660 [Streptomyces sp. CB02923]|uniref:type I-E CRISPR-associated protein Cse2/CasB n=1 Tax=Streptomyces sp. CB02923 TaxID=1718985 RepID=UPI0009401153|nr:type I-E CRISPR-associated protein Cse2/CasB [Streptomyces sp. CB02923]OKI09436.1 hypothetical protein A6A06_01660 [Streptomyces sp. CB02923]